MNGRTSLDAIAKCRTRLRFRCARAPSGPYKSTTLFVDARCVCAFFLGVWIGSFHFDAKRRRCKCNGELFLFLDVRKRWHLDQRVWHLREDSCQDAASCSQSRMSLYSPKFFLSWHPKTTLGSSQSPVHLQRPVLKQPSLFSTHLIFSRSLLIARNGVHKPPFRPFACTWSLGGFLTKCDLYSSTVSPKVCKKQRTLETKKIVHESPTQILAKRWPDRSNSST